MPGSFCAAKGCSNHSYNTKEKNISFHRFPVQSPVLLKQWLLAIKRTDYTPTAYSRLCSLHFEKSCFTYQNFTKRRQIKSDAIPTLFCHRSQSGHREGTLSQRLQLLKEKEFAESQALQANLAPSNGRGNFALHNGNLDPDLVPCLKPGYSIEEKPAGISCERVQLNEALGATKNMPLTDMRANSIVEIEQECVMEPEVILEESENCTLQYQPEAGIVSKVKSKGLCRTKLKTAESFVRKQDPEPSSWSSPSIIALPPSGLFLVEGVLGKPRALVGETARGSSRRKHHI